MIATMLEALARANIAAAAAVVLVFLLRRPVRRAFGARVAYELWSLPMLAALAVMLPQPSTEPLPFVADALATAGRAGPKAASAHPALWLALWLAGAAAMAAVIALRQARFVAALGPLQPMGDGTWRAERDGAGPAVVGAIRPRIVTPADFETRFAPAEREVILAHERAHLRTGDALVNALVAAAQCLCWFNPAVHVAARALRVDQELACDAAVVARFPQARRLYGELLLKTQLGGQPLPLGCHWFSTTSHPLKERIVMLKSPLPARGRKLAGLGLVATLAAACAGATWAAGPSRTIGAPDWIERPKAEDVAWAYPAAAKAQHQEGGATLSCRVKGDGGLADCQVVRETPAGAGFGQAALALAPTFRMTAKDKTGAKTAGADVRIPFLFKLPS